MILSKISIVQRCLKRIDDVTKGDPAAVDSLDCQEIVLLNLERAIQSTIDMAHTFIALHALGLPASYKQAFFILEQSKIIPPDLSAKMQAMVGFRNIAVHNYQELDIAVLKAILAKHLRDFEDFYQVLYQTI